MIGSHAYDSTELLPGTPPEAHLPAEERGLGRDEVRLLVSSRSGHRHLRFYELPKLLRRGDVLVVNRSMTLPASLDARLGSLDFKLNLSTRFGPRLWLTEARRSAAESGKLPLEPGRRFEVAGSGGTLLGSYPGIPRLRFVAFDEDPFTLLANSGRPIRYGYLERDLPLEYYQTVFADEPGSAEMPSAARPFTADTLAGLSAAGVELVKLTLHTGVSSLESSDLETDELYPEAFAVPAETASALNAAIAQERRVIAVGTTVVRALASAWDGKSFRPAGGMTRVYLRPSVAVPPVSGLLTGLHEPQATHLAMLEALMGRELVDSGYREALANDYLWHEFGDVQLLLRQ